MKIKLISKEQYNKLLSIKDKQPILTFQNKGYQYISKSKLTESDKNAIKEIESILREHIIGFQKFNNFVTTSDGCVGLRFQYNYGAEDDSFSFVGVGYIKLIELLNGFKE